MLLPASTTAAMTNAKASSLDEQIAYTKQQVKHDKQVIKRYLKRLHLHKKKLKKLRELQRIEILSPAASIFLVFGNNAHEAINVATCESGMNIYAKNGQYFGLFQMGIHERAIYATVGYTTAYEQTVAAYNYFKVSGWSPWECQP